MYDVDDHGRFEIVSIVRPCDPDCANGHGVLPDVPLDGRRLPRRPLRPVDVADRPHPGGAARVRPSWRASPQRHAACGRMATWSGTRTGRRHGPRCGTATPPLGTVRGVRPSAERPAVAGHVRSVVAGRCSDDHVTTDAAVMRRLPLQRAVPDPTGATRATPSPSFRTPSSATGSTSTPTATSGPAPKWPFGSSKRVAAGGRPGRRAEHVVGSHRRLPGGRRHQWRRHHRSRRDLGD